VINGVKCRHEIKFRIVAVKTAFDKKHNLLTSKLDFSLRKKLVKCYIWSIALNGAVTWTLRKVDQKYIESFKVWCRRRMEEIVGLNVWEVTECYRVKSEMNIPHTLKRRKANCIGHILCGNCCLEHVIEGEIKGRI